jgi:DNA-binding XRE family transcriptional regulator
MLFKSVFYRFCAFTTQKCHTSRALQNPLSMQVSARHHHSVTTPPPWFLHSQNTPPKMTFVPPELRSGPTVMADLSKNKQKEWAFELYMRTDLNQKQIAEKVGTSEQTMVEWVKDGDWKQKKLTTIGTKQQQLQLLYRQMDLTNKKNIEAMEDDDPETNPNYDAISKLSKAIHAIEAQTGIGEMIDTAVNLINFVQKEDPDAAKTISKWFDIFIKEQLQKLQLNG